MPTVNTALPENGKAPEGAPIPADILAAIAAATIFVGKRMRICGVEQMHSSHQAVSRWSRQGRVLVQLSHNLSVKHQAKTR